tara:strand:- start:517 stop:1965 length:1449 start_codon:yes stop_codon:yes gene_type:complete
METVLHGKDARKKLLAGVNKVANTVKGTLGPGAKTVIIQREGAYPTILNDGVSVAKAVTDPDPHVQMGIDLIKQVASQAQDKSGDGTTTATVLAQSLCNIGFAMIEDGVDPVEIKATLEAEAETIIRKIKTDAFPCDEDRLEAVATIAANNDAKLGALIAEVMIESGEDGAVSVETGSGFDTTIENVNGFEIHSGALSPHFPKELNDALILLVEYIDNFDNLIPALELAIKEGRSLLIIAEDYNQRILPNLLINVMQGKVNAALIKVPEMGKARLDWSWDIREATGSMIHSANDDTFSLKKPTLRHMGSATSVVIGRDTTIISTGKHKVAEMYIDRLFEAKDKAETDWEQQIITRRIARLQSGIASIKVGGHTEVEILETKERVDDAVNAVKAGMKNGVVAGGATLLTRYARESKYDLVNTAFQIPQQIIMMNAGIDKEFSADDMLSNDVYDPLDVVVNSIRSAVSVASLVLCSDATVSLGH